MSRLVRTACVTLAACGAIVVPASAIAQRGQTSGLAGTIRDVTNQPLAGAQIEISSPQLIGGPQDAQSDQNGYYRFTALLPGSYTLTAVAPGFETVQWSHIDLIAGALVTLDLTLNIARVGTTVEVHAVVPTIDVRSSASPQIIERPLLELLPRDSRQVSALIDLTPGIANGVALGGAAFANAIAVDGTNGTSPQQGVPEAAPAVYWLEDLQVIAVGANADYGEYSTARMNAVTRSGSNRFSGLAEHVWTRRAWAKWNELLSWRDTYGQAGGPLVKDRFWFFGGANSHAFTSRVTAFANTPRKPGEPLVRNDEQNMLFKLTSAPTSGVRLEGYASRESGDSLNGNASPRVSTEALGRFDNAQRLQNVRLTWTLTDRNLVEAHFGRYWGQNRQGPANADHNSGPPPHLDQATRVFSVNYPQIVVAARTVASGQATITHYMPDTGRGQHDLKAGAEYEAAHVEENQGYPGNTFYLDRDGQPDLVRLWEGSHYRPSHDRTSLFVRDIWQMKRLTLEPGVRLSFYDSSVPNPASRPYVNHAVSPRLGAAWDISTDHRTVVRAHYGHYHDPMSTRFYEYLDTTADSTFIVARVLGPDQFQEVSRSGAPTQVPQIDRNVKHSFAEEWFAGIEREMWPRLAIKAQYVRRNTRNTIGFVDEGSTWLPVEAIDPGPDGRSGTSDDGGPLTIYYNDGSQAARFLMTNPRGAWRHYDGIQLVGSRRPADGRSLQVSYAWGRTVGSFDNENGSNTAGTDVATNGNFANPNRAINTVGRTVFDRRHDVRVFGVYTLQHWGGARASAVYRYTSGAPWGRQVNSFDPRTQASAVLVEPVGTRQMPATNELDLRIEKMFRLRSATASVYANVFNVANRVVAAQVIQNSGSAFGAVTQWTAPRRFRMGLRVTF
jgi:carboxypeptidase family protein